jgi:hypothetical protein
VDVHLRLSRERGIPATLDVHRVARHGCRVGALTIADSLRHR